MTLDALIIGADSLIGSALMAEYKKLGISVAGTSRRSNSESISLDLSRLSNIENLPAANNIYLCAGINSFSACELDPVNTKRVNIDANLLIADYYLRKKSHIFFLSSTAVFGSKKEAPNEDEEASPNTLYGECKLAAELGLINLSQQYAGKLSIIRLTKVLSKQSELIQKWLTQAANQEPIQAFKDLYIAPLSLNYLVHRLLKITEACQIGTFHLSGEKLISYYELGQLLFKEWGSDAIVMPVEQSGTKGVIVQPQCNILSMNQTIEGLGIVQQSIQNFVKDMH